MIRWGTRHETRRRTVAVLTRPVAFEFFGGDVMEAGTEFVLGEDEGRAQLADDCSLRVRLAPEFAVTVPVGSFLLEVEEETSTVRTRTERWPARIV